MKLPRLLAVLVDEARTAGWSVKLSEEGLEVRSVIISADETQIIRTSHHNGAFNSASITFADQPGRVVVLRNVAAVRKQINLPPEERPVRAEVKIVRRRRPAQTARFAGETEDPGMPFDANRVLPFDLADPAPLILKELSGRVIAWRNPEMNRIEQGRLPADQRRLRLEPHPRTGRPMVAWQTAAQGWRFVLLDRIRRVLP